MKINRLARKMAALALSSVMLIIAGCGQAAPAATAPAEPAAQEEAAAETEAAVEEAGDIETLKIFCDELWWPYTEWKGRIPDKVTEKFGIKFEVTVPTDANQLNMMIASGDLGDVVCTGNFSRMCDSNLCYTLDELAEMYGKELNIHSVLRFVNTADDGNLYTLMAGYSPRSMLEGWDKVVYEQAAMVVRTDIYEELGSPEITNLDEFTDLLQQVKDNYPDIVPFVYSPWQMNNYIRILCGAVHDYDFVDVDGQAVPFILDPHFEKYFELMNDWYRRGFMTDDNFVWSGSGDDREYMIAGKVFADSNYSNTEDGFNVALADAGADFRVKTLDSLTYGQPGAGWVQATAGWRGLFIPKSCKDPEKVFDFVTWCFTQEAQELLLWGEEGVDWNWSEDHSYPEMNYDFYNPNRDDGMKFWGWMYHDGKMNVLPDYANGGATYDARKAITAISDSNPVLGMLRMGADSNEQVIMDNLKILYQNEATNIIRAASAEESHELYEKMIETAYSMGAEQLITWANETYERLKPEFDKIKDNVE